MKKILFLLILSGIVASGYCKPGSLRAYLSYSAFFAPGQGPYLETYLSILGNSIVYVKKVNGRFQGTVLITMLFKQHDSIKDFRKYELASPEVDDTTAINFSFLDQQRIPLADGTYDYELSISDKNRDRAPFIIKEPITVDFPADKIRVSGIELVESYKKAEEVGLLTKSGYDFVPYLYDYFPPSISKLTYYAEVYNMSSKMADEEKFGISASITSFETGKVTSSFLKIKRESPEPVNVVFGEFDISNLPSGNFNLVISVRDKENREIASGTSYFQRNNPSAQYNMADLASVDYSNSFATHYQNADTLREYLRMLYPISSASEKLFIKSQSKTASLEVLQQFFYSFWLSRDGKNPVTAWNTYYDQVLAVNREFHATNKKGYETDRGRVYLQYGQPSSRAQQYDEPRAYPYEIWQYYKLEKQTNRKFVFCAIDRSTGDFELIHSDAQGEIYNSRWELDLHSRDTGRYHSPQDIDRTTEDPAFGQHSSDYYNLPR